jgi:pimeloyl-ACP methyl ester carboxylesterase
VKLRFAEGPTAGPALILLHAQLMDWFDYSRVLPELSKYFHVFAVDYNGHGKTTAPASTMNANSIGNALAAFMEAEVSEPAFISGNSSGGLLTVWLAANKPKLVRAIVLEDPPLFSAEYPRVKRTIAYRSFTTCYNYLAGERTEDFLAYWIESNSAFIAKNAGKQAAPRLISAIKAYRKARPGEAVELRFLPDMMRMFIRGMSEFDPAFGSAFYTGEWNRDFDHAAALARIQCPVLLLQADFEILPDGTLNGAMDQGDIQKAMSLLPNATYQKIKAGHVIHLDKPLEYSKIIRGFFLGNTLRD